MPTILLLGPIGANQNEIVDFLVEEGDFTHVQFGRQETASTNDHRLYFTSPSAFLDYATLNWRKRFVTSQICSRNHLDAFIKRPWVLLVGCEAGIQWRWQRWNQDLQRALLPQIPLEQFVHDDDVNMFGPTPSEVDIREEQGLMSSSSTSTQTLHIPNGHSATHMTVNTLPPPSPELSKRFISRPPSPHKLEHTHKDPLAPLMRMCNLHIQMSRYPTTQDLRRHLRILDLPKEDRMRPGWDRYFMTLAGLASLRSNCMKRRVGAVLVSNKRVVSTGYNGTPRGMRNCNEGGCGRCNSTSVSTSGNNGNATPVKSGVALDECLCLHAEENALLEAGRERAGAGSGGVLYCNTCPCLRCSVKIVQCGISEVVYSQSYSMDEASARIFKEARVSMRQIQLSE